MSTLAHPQRQSPRWLQAAVAWHILLALAGVGGAVWFWLLPNDGRPAWQGWLVALLLLVSGIASAVAALFLWNQQHRGRLLSLAVNYLGFLAAFLGELHTLGLFLAIDQLAAVFGRGVLALLVAFVGYLVTTLAHGYEDNAARQRFFTRLGWMIILAAVVAFLITIGIFSGLKALLLRFDNPLTVGLAMAAFLFGLALWVIGRRPAAEWLGATNAQDEMLAGYLFLSPNLLGFLFFFAGPLLFSLYVSFTDWDAFGTKNWVGLANYAEIFSLDIARLASVDQPAAEVIDVQRFTELSRLDFFGRYYLIAARDKLLWLSLYNTLLFTLLAVPASVIPALLLANLLNSKIPGMGFFRAVYFLPSVAAVVGVALIWQWLYNSTVGYINFGITSLVNLINDLLGATIRDPQVRWLSDSNTALIAIVIMSAWQTIGFNTILFLAGLQTIPKDLYEAATVDGANHWTRFWNVTLPMLAPTTFFVVTTTTIGAMQVFEQVFILTNPPGGPNNSTLTMVLYLYQNGFQRFRQGYASAIAWVLFLVIFGLTLLQFQRQRAAGSAYD
jgi:ABC-type sugar transport system permease subunit